MKITATIITLNEERNIARAIESLRCCDEILIVDSGSADRTVELAEKLGARVIEAGWRGYAGAEKLGGRASRPRLDSLARRRRSAERSAGSRDLESQKSRPAVRRLHHAAHGPLPGPLDSALGLVSRPQGAALRPAQGQLGGRFRARERAGAAAAWATWRATSCTSPAIRFPSTSRPWTATPRWRRRSWPRAQMQGAALAPDCRPRLDVCENLLPPARISGWPGGPDHRLDGGVLHVSEILQSEKHELMRILHLDAGKEMRGGQWQVLRLMEGLAAAGVESTLLARAARAALRGRAPTGLARRAAGRWRGPRCWPRRHDLVHAHDARSHTLRRPSRRRAGWWSRGGWRSRCGSRLEVPARAALPGGFGVREVGVWWPAACRKKKSRGLRRRSAARTARGTSVLAPANAGDPRKGRAAGRGSGAPGGRGAEALDAIWSATCRDAAVFVYITHSEGLGSGALLAMSAGVPVIASNVGGLPEIVRARRDRAAGGKHARRHRRRPPRTAGRSRVRAPRWAPRRAAP